MLGRWITLLLLAASFLKMTQAVYTASKIYLPDNFQVHETPANEEQVPGDKIQIIAQELNVPISLLEESNPQIQDFDNISPGEVFNVPARPVDNNLIICGEQYYLKTQVGFNIGCKFIN